MKFACKINSAITSRKRGKKTVCLWTALNYDTSRENKSEERNTCEINFHRFPNTTGKIIEYKVQQRIITSEIVIKLVGPVCVLSAWIVSHTHRTTIQNKFSCCLTWIYVKSANQFLYTILLLFVIPLEFMSQPFFVCEFINLFAFCWNQTNLLR